MKIIKKSFKYLIWLGLLSAVFFIAKDLISGVENEVEFHQNHIESYDSIITLPGLELSKTELDAGGNMKLLGNIMFWTKLNKTQFDNFWAEQTDFDIVNGLVIVEMNKELNSFTSDIKFDVTKEYYKGSTYYDWEETFYSDINFNFSEIYIKLPEKAFLKNGSIDPEYEYNMYITFKSVLYNSDLTDDGKPIYTTNNAKYTFNIIENKNSKLMLNQVGDVEIINEKVNMVRLNWIDKIKNKFKDFWGD